MRYELAVAITLLACIGHVVGQDGVIPFYAAQSIVTNQERLDTSLDLDLDGDVDYLGNYQGLKWFENSGNGLPSATHMISSTASALGNFCLTDLDGDGNLDAVCFAGTEAFAILSRIGGPIWQQTAITGLGFEPFAADLQGDGTVEFVCQSGSFTKGYSFDPATNTFASLFSMHTGTTSMFVADYDGDGRDEIWRHNTSWLWVMEVDGTWTATNSTLLANALGEHLLPTVGDIDGDGDEDLVLFTDQGGARFVVFRRDASGQLLEEPQLAGGPATHLGDVDGDGDLDGLCCGGGTSSNPQNNWPSDYMISFNDGNGVFAPAQAVHGHGARQLAGCVDVDGDGDRDLIGGRTVIFNPGEIRDVFASWGGYGPHRYEAFLDADGDLDADFGLALGGSSASWRESLGDGSFFNQSTGLGPNASAGGLGLVADFDGDGLPDGLTQDGSGATTQVYLHHNNGGAFSYPVAAAPPGLSMRQASQPLGGNGVTWANNWSFVSDWDGDGDLDAVVCDESQGWSKLFRNDGNGFFVAGPSIPAGVMIMGVADFTGDGVPDLLTSSPGDLTVLGIAPGTAAGFGPVAPLAAGDARRDERPGIADIDSDGDIDILSSSQTGGVLLRNLGTGNFAVEPQNFRSPRHAWWSFADVDENGTLDAVWRQPYYERSETSAIILQNLDGTFAPPVILVTKIAGFVDIDRDGDLDLLGSEVIKNRTAQGSFGVLRQFGQGPTGTWQVRPRINDLGITAPGNPMIMRVSGMVGGAPGLWVLGIGAADLPDNPLPGLTLYVDQILSITPFVASGPTGVPGKGTWAIPWQMISGFGGLELSSQAFCADALAPQGWTHTNGKVMTLPH